MTIKSDRWITKMALEQGMIEPFFKNQTKQEIDHLCGVQYYKSVISYGTSSYGYDIRCANEFKIFTNVNNCIVDPKNFDEKSFVSIEGDYCIIPPNSFALARSVEYIKVPSNVLVVCLGKCITSDTKIVNSRTGDYCNITEINAGDETISLGENGMQKSYVSDFVSQGVKKVFRLKTKSGLEITATKNHPFRKFNEWAELSELKIGDRIAVARNIPCFGNTNIKDSEMIFLGLMIGDGQCNTPNHSPCYTKKDKANVDLLEWAVSDLEIGGVTSKGNYAYRIVNRKGRGGIPEKNKAHELLKKHEINVLSGEKKIPRSVFLAPKESVAIFLKSLFSGDSHLHLNEEKGLIILEYYSKSKKLITGLHHLLLRFNIFSYIKYKVTKINIDAYRIQICDKDEILKFFNEIGYIPGSNKYKKMIQAIDFLKINPKKKSNFDNLPKECIPTIQNICEKHKIKINSIGIRVNKEKPLPIKYLRKLFEITQDEEILKLINGPVWDTVVSIEELGEQEVFDISVPELHNFIANDIIVHNSTYARCGIIVNTTPMEPLWEGHITLEFSNTTPLPAKIYANEGIAQLLFFESDEQCETTYADRNGKYQGQTGVTLPRI